MKRVFIHAYMAGNLGDDLLVRILCQRYEKVKFFILADESYKLRFEKVRNLKVYSPNDKSVVFWNKFWKKTKKVDNGFWKMLIKSSYASVHIGGSVFVQHFDDYSAFYNTDVTLRRLSRRMYLIGANFGPYTDENYYKQYHELLSTYDGICFRDKYSYNLFSDSANVNYAPDVVFNYKSEEKNVVEKKQVLISVIELKSRDGKFSICNYMEEYKKFLINVSALYIAKGYSIKFVSFCETQGDARAIEELMPAFSVEQKKMIETYTYDMDIESCIQLFDESEIIVATRFHGVILGWLKKKKVLPIVYDLKTLHTLMDNGCSVYVTLDELKNANVESLINSIEKLPDELVEQLKQEAGRQFWKTDKLFGVN